VVASEHTRPVLAIPVRASDIDLGYPVDVGSIIGPRAAISSRSSRAMSLVRSQTTRSWEAP